MAKPGVMLYFDLLEPLRILTDSDRGKLILAILEYGQDGREPDFKGSLAMAWGFIRPKIDRDDESYESAAQQRRYANFCKKRSSLNLPRIPYQKWLELPQSLRDNPAMADTGPDRAGDARDPSAAATVTPTVSPTATPTATPTVTPSVSAAAAPFRCADRDGAAAAAERKLKYLNGELGKGVVVLSEYQVEMLLEKLGLDMFDHYVAKLADYILHNGASVKNHYATILKWWTEDSVC